MNVMRRYEYIYSMWVRVVWLDGNFREKKIEAKELSGKKTKDRVVRRRLVSDMGHR